MPDKYAAQQNVKCFHLIAESDFFILQQENVAFLAMNNTNSRKLA